MNESNTIFKEYSIPNYITVSFTITTLIIVVTNVLYSLVIIRSKSLHNISGYLMLHLSASDILLGFLLIFSNYAILIKGKLELYVCALTAMGAPLLSCVSVWTIMLLNIDRYISITQPFYYNSIVTTKNMCIALLSIWLLLLSLSLSLIFKGSYVVNEYTLKCSSNFKDNKISWIIIIILTFVISIIVFLFIYIHLGYIAIKSKISGSNAKALRTLALLFCCFYVSWTPVVVNIISKALDKPVKMNRIGNVFVLIFMYMNGFWNCVIYALTNKKFKFEMFKLLKIKTRDIMDSQISYA